MSENPAPADPVTAEDGIYAAVFSDYLGLRRAGAGIIAAACLTAAYRLMAEKATEA